MEIVVDLSDRLIETRLFRKSAEGTVWRPTDHFREADSGTNLPSTRLGDLAAAQLEDRRNFSRRAGISWSIWYTWQSYISLSTSHYSCLSTTMGSTLVARRAGT